MPLCKGYEENLEFTCYDIAFISKQLKQENVFKGVSILIIKELHLMVPSCGGGGVKEASLLVDVDVHLILLLDRYIDR